LDTGGKEGHAGVRPYELYFIIKRQEEFVDQQYEGADYQIPSVIDSQAQIYFIPLTGTTVDDSREPFL
jgi:hypothetical protein